MVRNGADVVTIRWQPSNRVSESYRAVRGVRDAYRRGKEWRSAGGDSVVLERTSYRRVSADLWEPRRREHCLRERGR